MREKCVWMAGKVTEWPSNRGPISKIWQSDGCNGDTVPLAVRQWYNFHSVGCHLGNVGYSTLYAVKRPGAGPSYSREQRSIQALFGEQFLGEVLDPSTDRDLYLRGYDPRSDGPAMVVPMPALRSPTKALSRLSGGVFEIGLQ